MQPDQLTRKNSEIERILKPWACVPMAITGLIVFGVLAPLAYMVFGADSGTGSFIIQNVPRAITAVVFANMGGLAAVFYSYRRHLNQRQLHEENPDYNKRPIRLGKYMAIGSLGGILAWALISTGAHYTIRLMTG